MPTPGEYSDELKLERVKRAEPSKWSIFDQLPAHRNFNPGFTQRIVVRRIRFRDALVCETSTGNSNLVRECGDKPEERRTTGLAEVSFLIMILRFMMKCVDMSLTALLYN